MGSVSKWAFGTGFNKVDGNSEWRTGVVGVEGGWMSGDWQDYILRECELCNVSVTVCGPRSRNDRVRDEDRA